MGGFPYWGVNPGFSWFMLFIPLLCFAMMFFFCRSGFRRDRGRAFTCWSNWNRQDGLADEVAALRKEVELLKQNNR